MPIEKAKSRFKGHLTADEETLESLSTDFGRLVKKVPSMVAVPAVAQDVQTMVQLANEEGWTVSTRGAAHSQSGQSLSDGGILLDMQGLNKIGPIEGDSVWVDGGVVWGDLVEQTLARGLVPPVLTNNLNVTVGGTVSMAGLGVASHRFGTQTDNVLELEVVTGVGDLVSCSSDENRELFDCARCGLGQFSVITRAKLKLRPVLSSVRTYYLLYDDLGSLMKDQAHVLRSQKFDYIEGWCSPCVQGLKTFGEAKVPFAEWFYPVHLTVEHGGTAPSDSILAGLKFYRHVHTEDVSFPSYVRRLEPVFQMWRESGSWNMAHPWMEVVLPWERAAEYIQGVLRSFPPNLLIGGHVLLWPCTGSTTNAPLFMRPDGDFVMGFGILPAVPRHLVKMAVSLLNRASDLCIQLGGKRYLSGWVDFDHERWKAHFGDQWPQFVQWKEFFDPKGVLNPGFLKYTE
jgi:cytokinin dehydrogenase